MVNQFSIWQKNKKDPRWRDAPQDKGANVTSVVREKREPKPINSMLPSFSLPGLVRGSGPKSLSGSRDAWANALNEMSGVYTPTPLTALAKVAGMGLAGYGVGKAQGDIDKGTSDYRKKLATLLAGGTVDNAALGEMMGSDWASPGDEALMLKLWERNNPSQADSLAIENQRLTNQKLKQELATPEATDYDVVEGPDNRKYYIDKTDPTAPAIPIEGMGEGKKKSGIDNPMSITGQIQGNQQWRDYQVGAATLNSMWNSFQDKSAISDLDYIIGVAKILDPSSVVRTQEGEQVRATQSLPAQLAGQFNQLLSGGQELDMKTRADLYRLAQNRVDELGKQAKMTHDQYAAIAEANGHDPNIYVPGMPPLPPGRVGEAQKLPQVPPGWRPGAPAMPSQTSPEAPPAPSPQATATPVAPPPPRPPVAAPAPPVRAPQPGPFPPRPGEAAGGFPAQPAMTGPFPPRPEMPGSFPAAQEVQDVPAWQSPVTGSGIQAAPGIPDFGVRPTPPPPWMSDAPPMPDDLRTIIPTPVWGFMVQHADSPEDLFTALDIIRQNPEVILQNFPQFFATGGR